MRGLRGGRPALLLSIATTALLLGALAAGLSRSTGQAGTPYLGLGLAAAQPLADGRARLVLDVDNRQGADMPARVIVDDPSLAGSVWNGSLALAANSAGQATVELSAPCGRPLRVRLEAGDLTRTIAAVIPCPIGAP